MKLYDLPRNTPFTLNKQQEGDILPDEYTKEVYLLHHVDGMYSFCTDNQSNVHHFVAWMEVNPVNNT